MWGVSAPLDFLKIFAGQLRQAEIAFAITSGMACVHYGLQQITKDSDWIIPVEDLAKLRGLLARLEGELPPWRVSYRRICGAPLEASFMEHGWTSHLSIWDSAGSVEHKVDIFSKAPRVQSEELESDAEGWASRHIVAQMKRTDREKDWPIVHRLGEQLWERHRAEGLLHINDGNLLAVAWRAAGEQSRLKMAARRPLLKMLDLPGGMDRLGLERLLLLERLLWERVNQHRHSRYTRAWRRFYRDWRKEPDWDWPTAESFDRQHQRLLEAAGTHELPLNPFEGLPKEDLIEMAVREVCQVAAATRTEVAQVLPPVYELLP